MLMLSGSSGLGRGPGGGLVGAVLGGFGSSWLVPPVGPGCPGTSKLGMPDGGAGTDGADGRVGCSAEAG